MEKALARLRAYGYGEEEARFLCLAAQHSGYFVRRQFNEFIGQSRGARAQRFVDKLLAHRHALATRFGLNQIVYHVRAKALYSRLGQVDNRNRREKAPLTVKRKLMCLDFVLAHREKRFLTAEPEKFEYFAVERGVELDRLPAREYHSHRSRESTSRFFVEKLPIFLDPGFSPSPVVHFVYVDEGAQSLEGFATYLRQYRSLLAGLGRFEVIYAAAEPRWFAKAETIFRRMFPAEGSAATEFATPDERELLDYFEARRKFETRSFAGLDVGRIARFREQKRKFTGPRYDQMYLAWKDRIAASAVVAEARAALDTRFAVYLAPHDYEMIRSFPHAS